MVDTSPVPVGLLFDFPQPDQGAGFEEAVRLGLAEVEAAGRPVRPVELVHRHTRGHPLGEISDVERGFRELDAEGVALIIGPSISDNTLAVRPLADATQLPCINYTGGERTRSEWMFHYQVGSLEEEPPVLARRLSQRGLRRMGVIHDASVVGDRYLECFTWAAARLGLEITAATSIAPTADDVTDAVRVLREPRPDALVYFGVGAASHAVATALDAIDWPVPVVANSALMFGYARPDWRDAWRGWEYLDNIADDNRVRIALRERSPRAAAGPIGCAAYDIGRLVGEAIARADDLDRAGLREGLERVKQLPAASGRDGTLMGFGVWDRAALKGHYLVLREWRGGKTVQVEGQGALE